MSKKKEKVIISPDHTLLRRYPHPNRPNMDFIKEDGSV